ncbi:MAG: hypothetical protein ABI432_06470 [Flavobacteriales bacterium]
MYNGPCIIVVLTAFCSAGCSTRPLDTEVTSAQVDPIIWSWCSALPADSAVFLPGHVSLPDRVEQGITFSPSGDTLVFSTIIGRRNDRNLWAMLWCARVNGNWTIPDTLPFSGTFSDYGPAFAPDGGTLYFSSRRPIADTTAVIPTDYDLWKVDLAAETWGTAVRLANGVNTNGNEYSVTASRTHLVFCADRNDALGRSDLFTVERVDELNEFAGVRNMGAPVSSPMWEGAAYLSTNGDGLWWNHVDEGHSASEDILHSQLIEGRWTLPVPLGGRINTDANEFMHCATQDGRRIFFGRHGDILSAPL